MGHRIDRMGRMFSGVCYKRKTAAELRTAMSAKVTEIQARIQDRKQRVERIRQEYQIDAERLAVLLIRFQNDDESMSFERQGEGPLVPAGVIANIVREHDMVDNEEEQVLKLQLVLRNLTDEVQFAVEGTGEIKTRPAVHELSDDELVYLGF